MTTFNNRWNFFTPMREFLTELAAQRIPVKGEPTALHIHGRYQRPGQPFINEVVLTTTCAATSGKAIWVSVDTYPQTDQLAFVVAPYIYAGGPKEQFRVYRTEFMDAQNLVLQWLARVVDPSWDPRVPVSTG